MWPRTGSGGGGLAPVGRFTQHPPNAGAGDFGYGDGALGPCQSV